MAITACYPFLTTDRMAESKAWYRSLGYRVVVESPAWTHLAVPGNPTLQLGLLDIGHASVRPPFDVPGRLFLGLMASDAGDPAAGQRGEGGAADAASGEEPWGRWRFIAIDPDGGAATLTAAETPFTHVIRTLMAA
jgi:hypothetical protein